jgi:hypothetical protein
MSFFRKSQLQTEIPVDSEREDLLADIARRAGERKQQAKTLLEDFARREDERRQASFQATLEDLEPAASKAPLLSIERRWSTRTEPPGSADVAKLEHRIATLEAEQRKLVEIVEGLIAVLNGSRREMSRAAER